MSTDTVPGSSADMVPFAIGEPAPACPKCGAATKVIGRAQLGAQPITYYTCPTCRHAGDTRPKLK